MTSLSTKVYLRDHYYVIASEAKQSRLRQTPSQHGSPRRCAPRDDGMLRPDPSVRDTKPSLRLHEANPSLRSHAANPSLRGRRPWQSMTSSTHGSPRRCAPRDDGMLRPDPSVGDTKPSLRLHEANPSLRLHGANPSLRGRRPWQSMTSRTHGSPRRCAPRDDALARGLLVALSFQGHAPGAFRFATGAAHAV